MLELNLFDTSNNTKYVGTLNRLNINFNVQINFTLNIVTYLVLNLSCKHHLSKKIS